MAIAFLAFYLLTHAMGFAGIGMVVFICIYEKDARDVRYLAFLVSFFLYVALSNAGFICSSFMGDPSYFLDTWYFVAYMGITSLLMAAYSVFIHGLPKVKQSRHILGKLIAASCLPLVYLVFGLIVVPSAESAEARVFLMRAAAVTLTILLLYSIKFMRANRNNAIDAECAMMMRFSIVTNSLLIIPFLAETWYNYDVTHPYIPLSAESAYYLTLSVANVGWLAHGVLLKRKRALEAAFSARDAYAQAALNPDSLGDREKNILAYLMLGLGNKQIAAHLEMTEFMVRNHISALLKKAGARNRVELVELYRKTLSR